MTINPFPFPRSTKTSGIFKLPFLSITSYFLGIDGTATGLIQYDLKMARKETVNMRRTILLVLVMLLSLFALTNAQGHKFGLGIIVGEPTGPSFKYWTSGSTAIDGAVAWSMAENAGMHLHADYLFYHNFSLIEVEKGRLPLYIGVGGRIRFADHGDDRIGVRVPVGLEYIFPSNQVDLFLEIVPILDLAPDTDLDFNAALGVRYFF